MLFLNLSVLQNGEISNKKKEFKVKVEPWFDQGIHYPHLLGHKNRRHTEVAACYHRGDGEPGDGVRVNQWRVKTGAPK